MPLIDYLRVFNVSKLPKNRQGLELLMQIGVMINREWRMVFSDVAFEAFSEV